MLWYDNGPRYNEPGDWEKCRKRCEDWSAGMCLSFEYAYDHCIISEKDQYIGDLRQYDTYTYGEKCDGNFFNLSISFIKSLTLQPEHSAPH